jgi:hypothetical protein
VGVSVLKEFQKVLGKEYNIMFAIILHLALCAFINLVGNMSYCELLILHTIRKSLAVEFQLIFYWPTAAHLLNIEFFGGKFPSDILAWFPKNPSRKAKLL